VFYFDGRAAVYRRSNSSKSTAIKPKRSIISVGTTYCAPVPTSTNASQKSASFDPAGPKAVPAIRPSRADLPRKDESPYPPADSC